MAELASMANIVFLGIIAVQSFLLVLVLFYQYKQRRDRELQSAQQKMLISNLQIQVHELAAQKFEDFKNTVLPTEQERIRAEQKVVAEASLELWKMEYETLIRQDAIKKSQAVTIGKVTEHMIPYFSGTFPYNPKEARFIGSPVDLIVFDGMETEPENISVHFIEVKTASSSLTPKQRAIKYAILNKRVEWKELRV